MDLSQRSAPVKFLIRNHASQFTTSSDAVFTAEGIRILASPPGRQIRQARTPLTNRPRFRAVVICFRSRQEETPMSVYNVIEIIGTSSTSWEEAAAEAVRTASQTIRDLRVAEVVEQDIHLDEGGAITYRTKLRISFKYAPGQ
jgi:flavin-binding protein dodecin